MRLYTFLFLAPLLTLALIPQLPVNIAWRYLFFIGGLPILSVPLLMRWMPESPRWLQIKGRVVEADAILSVIEAHVERRSGQPLPPPRISAEAEETQGPSTSMRDVFKAGYLKRTAMMWVAFSCILFLFYAIQTYTPTILVKEGSTPDTPFLLTSIIVLASVPGKYCAAYALARI